MRPYTDGLANTEPLLINGTAAGGPWRRWLRPLALVSLSVVAATSIAMVALLFTLHSNQVQTRLDIIKTALTVGAGVGALITLMYGARRQLLAEETAQDQKIDAAEKRVIELYTKGIEQLGSEKLPVRLGGLYALERLADNTPDIRERVIDVMCAYIKDASRAREVTSSERDYCIEAAQTILVDHLAYQSPFAYHKNFWPTNEVNLSGASLRNFYARGGKGGYRTLQPDCI